jgi:glyoxylase-like metal-dependent hydrolase (beta-lactamase superfamily II)
MIITKTGKIADGFYSVGHSSVPVYLLDGAEPVLFDAGFSGLAFAYEKDIRNILGPRSPKFLFLTHSHWDHIGSVAHLQNVWPALKIIGSSRIRAVLEHPSAVTRIRSLSEDSINTLISWGVTDINRAPFQPFRLDMTLDLQNPIPLAGGLKVHPIPTPGHTWDSYSYWIPSRRILIAGEAVLCDGICEFLVDYDVYRQSLKRLSELDVDILCTGHHTVVTGNQAREYILDSTAQTEQYLQLVEKLAVEENGNLERIVVRIKAVEWDNRPLPKQPEKAYVINTRIRVRNILQKSGGRGVRTD